jgi:hypothetical protein
MTEDQKKDQLDEFMVSIELPVRAWNALLNACNMPFQTPTTAFSDFIMAIQSQAGPQVEQAKKSLDAVAENADHVPIELEGRN